MCAPPAGCRCPTAAGVPEGAAASGAASPVLCAEQLGGAPSAFASALHAAVSSLVPLSAVLPLTVEACNRWASAATKFCYPELIAVDLVCVPHALCCVV